MVTPLFARVNSMGLTGVDGFIVDVQTDLSSGLPGFEVVGLPGAAVKESRDRVRSAIKNGGFTYPISRITVNLAPADVRKEGSVYDLPLMISILLADEQMKTDVSDAAFVGELSLAGDVCGIRGVLPMVIAARDAGLKRVFIPLQNAAEGAVVDGITVFAVPNIASLLGHLSGAAPLEPVGQGAVTYDARGGIPDYADVRGQTAARRALEVAAAGGHNILLIGPPGSGKSMLACRLPGILPEMTREEALQVTKIHSIAGTLPGGAGLMRERPFRAPHHGVSAAGLTGGGAVPRPGEVSLAHHGVLFLDELPEFARTVMECLRQPLENGVVTISRVSATLTYPCRLMLVAAMNPCPCGYFGHPTHMCRCSPEARQKYISRISGPLLDRIDLHVEVPPVEFDQLTGLDAEQPESSHDMRERVNAARQRQVSRFAGTPVTSNAHMSSGMLRESCTVTAAASALLRDAFDRMALSARAYDRLLKVSRTIADLDDSDGIDLPHVAEAVQYRGMDRKYWQK